MILHQELSKFKYPQVVFHLTQHNQCKGYSFILPNATPAMMYFESAKYTMNSGSTVKVNPR